MSAAATEPTPWRVVRAMVFRDRPDCLLFYVPDGVTLAMPAGLTAPFTKQSVADAFGQAGTPIRITESVPGRWKDSIHMMRKAERAERRQRQNLKAATLASLERSGAPLAQSRADAIARKQSIETSIQSIKTWIGEASTRARTRGIYADPALFRTKQRRLAELTEDLQAVQVQLSALRKQQAAENRTAHLEEAELFKEAARRLLPPETFARLLDAVFEAREAADEEEGVAQ